MKSLAAFLLTLSSIFVGCQSVEGQRQRFIEYQKREIGRPFYSHEARGTREVKISESESEFVPDPMPTSGFGLVWRVDTRTRGPYTHPTNRMTFQIEGVKMSWRLIGDPSKAVMKIDWLGPW